MVDVQFEEERNYTNTATPSYSSVKKSGGITALLIKWGIAKNDSGAKVVMIGIIIVCVIISVLVITNTGPAENLLTEEELRDSLIKNLGQ
jgi:hypothetical protein